MSKQLSIITIHGMGNTDKDYYHNLQRRLKNIIGDESWNEKIHLESIFYQDLLQHNQEEYWRAINKKYHLKWDFLRRFMLYKFSDGAAIEHSLHSDMVLYLQVHRKIATALDNSLNILENPNKPVIVIAHSLGCEQVSNYLWDAKRSLRFFAEENDDGASIEQWEFRRFQSCKLFATTGCNIPIFRAGMTEPLLFKRPNDNFKWVNYFDPYDVLAYPIKDMSPSFDVPWINDKKIRVSGWLKRWTPLSHSQYWISDSVITPIAREIQKLLDD